jgi:hypothetical protein
MAAQSAKGSPGALPAKEESSWINWGPMFQGLFDSVESDPLAAGILLVMGLMLLSYPLLALVRSLRVKLSASTGIARQPQTIIENHTHHTSSSYNPHTGHYTSGSTTTTSHRSDEFSLVGNDWETRVFLRNAYFPVRDGNNVTVVWSSGWPCHVYNHTTRESRNLHSGVRLARGHTFPVALLWTLLVLGVGYLLTLPFGAGMMPLKPGQPSWEPLLMAFAAIGLTFWVIGGVLMRIVHIFGDYRVLQRARRLGQG